jgi:two-component system, NtrC family, sensor histidine kinase HydH
VRGTSIALGRGMALLALKPHLSEMSSEASVPMDDLVLRVAHEIRNPLTSIKLLVQTAAQRPGNSRLDTKQLDVIQEDVSRIERTVQELLDFTRPRPLRPVRHDLRQTLQRAANLVEGRSRQRDVAIVATSPSSPVQVYADPEQLQQVFMNLLLEGVESVRPGETVKAALQTASDPSPLGIVTFSQPLHSMRTGRTDHLRDPFAAGSCRGTGLALAISRDIVERHGGKLTAAGQDRKRAVFTVEIPLA